MITGQVQQVETNPQYGFSRYNISGAWYGADKKGRLAEVGETVSFEYFDKPGKDGRTWPTIKTATFRKQGGNSPSPGAVAVPSSAQQRGHTGTYSGGASKAPAGRDTYWKDKADNDAAKEPRIAYFAALERAISFVDLALRNGAISAYEKAKATGKLEVLTALVYETTQKIMAESYAATVPAPKAASIPQPELSGDTEAEESDEEWS